MSATSSPSSAASRFGREDGPPRPQAGGSLPRLWNNLRSGDWATPQRLRIYAGLVLAGSAVGILMLLLTSDGLRDRLGRPLGTDFSQVWVAGRTVLAGRPAQPFDPAAHAAAQQAAFGPDTPFYGWHYPPYFLGLAALLALLPYQAALALWQGLSGLAYLAVMRAAGRAGRVPLRMRDVMLAAAAFPAVFVNLTHGHNGFLTAALMGFGSLALPRRPLLAGLLFGLLCYKPQFGLVLPVALLAMGAWRTIAAAAATVAALTLATLAGFGLVTWQAFRTSLAFTRTVVLESGDTGWEKIQSPFAAARLLGAGLDTAYAVQGAVTLGVLAAVALVWHGRADIRLKAALLMVASLLVTPYCLDYDLTLLGPALVLVVTRAQETGWRPWEKTLLAAVWVLPGIARVLGGALHLPLGAPLMLALVVILVRRSRSESDRQATLVHPETA